VGALSFWGEGPSNAWVDPVVLIHFKHCPANCSRHIAVLLHATTTSLYICRYYQSYVHMYLIPALSVARNRRVTASRSAGDIDSRIRVSLRELSGVSLFNRIVNDSLSILKKFL